MHSITVTKHLTLLLLSALLLFTSACGVQQRVEVPRRQGQFGGQCLSDTLEVPEEVALPAPPSVPYALDESVVTPDRMCTGVEGVDEAVVDGVNTTLLMIPRWLRECFISSGWSMQVVDYDLATEDYDGQFSAGRVYGSTSYSSHLIKIQNDMLATAMAPIHELGHWFDSCLGYPSLYSEDFIALYEAEGQLYRDTFGPTCSWNIQEFIAEGFWCYWQSPVALQKACPLFFQFVESNLSLLKTSTEGEIG